MQSSVRRFVVVKCKLAALRLIFATSNAAVGKCTFYLEVKLIDFQAKQASTDWSA
jgi:hypothetical protein